MEIHLAASGEFTSLMTNMNSVKKRKKERKEISPIFKKRLKFGSREAAGWQFISQKEPLGLRGEEFV